MAMMGAASTKTSASRINPISSMAAPPEPAQAELVGGCPPLRRSKGSAAVLGGLPALNYQAMVLLARGSLDVGQRIAVAQHEVGRVAFLDAALVGKPHQVGGTGRRDEQRVARRYADLAHELELAGVLAVPV